MVLRSKCIKLLAVLFFIASGATLTYAAPAQLTHDTPLDATFNGGQVMDVEQTLGTGLTGSFSAMELWVDSKADIFAANQMRIYECTDATYVTCTLFYNVTQNSPLISNSTLVFASSSSAVFNPTKYYAFLGSVIYTAGQARVYGSFSDTYSGGSAVNGIGVLPAASPDPTGIVSDFYFQFYETYTGCPLGVTCILSVTPSNGSTIATSTSAIFAVNGYLSSEDYDSGNNKVRVTLSYSQSAGAHWYSPVAVASCRIGIFDDSDTCDYYEWELPSAGSFNVSTTTALLDTGRYNMDASIDAQQLWVLTRNLTATSTQFTVVGATGLDLLHDRIAGEFASTTASSTLDLSSCNLISGSFNVLTCGYALIVPPQDLIKTSFVNFYNGALQVVPFGYVTRFVTIISTGTAVIPPPLSYEFGSSSPQVLQTISNGDPVTFQIFDQFDELESIRTDDGQDKGIWDIIMPWFNIFVILAVLLLILEDLLGWSIQSDRTQETSVVQSKNVDGSSFTTTTKHSQTNATATFKNNTFGRHVDRFNKTQRRDK